MNTADTTIADQVARILRESAEHLPAHVLAALESERAELNARGVPDNVLKAGALMPDGDLLDVNCLAIPEASGKPGWPPVLHRGRTPVMRRPAPPECTHGATQIGGYRTSVLPRPSQGVTVIAATGSAWCHGCGGRGDRRPRTQSGWRTSQRRR
jgi:hypothetical protein